MSNLDDLAAALNNHQVTDNQGQVGETTSTEEPAPQEQTPEVKEEATEGKPAESKESAPAEAKETENEPELVETASDETGKRYVPESRFKEVYAKMKAYERKLPKREEPIQPPPVQQQSFNKADALEIELLRSTLPQFNRDSPEYSEDIDKLGFSIYEGSKDRFGNYQMTRIEAGKQAISMVNKITSKVTAIKDEAKTVKAQQSDQGITNRVLNREGTKPDPEKMTLEEKEEWLKAQGEWDKRT